MEKTFTQKQNSRIIWLDVLRFIAIFMVIACHCTDPFNASPAARSNPDISFWGMAYGSFLRPCVPLFVMMTGFLLLPTREESSVFYKKRIPRVLYPFLLWSVLFNLSPWFIQFVGGSKELVIDFFPWEQHPSSALSEALKNVAMIPVNFSVYATPMWYVYTLIGLYLYLPIFSAWVEKASDRSKRWFLVIWGVTLFLPYVMVAYSNYLLGTCSWNSFGLLYYFSGFNGYLLLGHYIGNMRKPSMKQFLAIGIPLFIVGFVITFLGFRYMISDPDVTESGMELFFTYCSPNVVMMTVPIFMFARYINVKSVRIQGALAHIAKCGFGMYCVHYFFVGPAYLFAEYIGVPLPLIIPVSAIVAFICTWVTVGLLGKLPRSRYLIG